jgi:hypothetical protein
MKILINSTNPGKITMTFGDYNEPEAVLDNLTTADIHQLKEHLANWDRTRSIHRIFQANTRSKGWGSYQLRSCP